MLSFLPLVLLAVPVPVGCWPGVPMTPNLLTSGLTSFCADPRFHVKVSRNVWLPWAIQTVGPPELLR